LAPPHLPVYLSALEPHHRRLDVGHFWLESDPALRRKRGSVSVMASMLLDKFGFERHVIDPKEAT
jgi:hypothetical protein